MSLGEQIFKSKATNMGSFLAGLLTQWLVVFQGVLFFTMVTKLSDSYWYADLAIWVVCLVVTTILTFAEID